MVGQKLVDSYQSEFSVQRQVVRETYEIWSSSPVDFYSTRGTAYALPIFQSSVNLPAEEPPCEGAKETDPVFPDVGTYYVYLHCMECCRQVHNKIFLYRGIKPTLGLQTLASSVMKQYTVNFACLGFGEIYITYVVKLLSNDLLTRLLNSCCILPFNHVPTLSNRYC